MHKAAIAVTHIKMEQSWNLNSAHTVAKLCAAVQNQDSRLTWDGLLVAHGEVPAGCLGRHLSRGVAGDAASGSVPAVASHRFTLGG